VFRRIPPRRPAKSHRTQDGFGGELFPTQIRSTGVGFTTGSARIITSFGPLVAGLMVGAFGGSFNKVTAIMTCFAALSVVAMILGRETKGAGLSP
jgi:hypothetical protein